MTVGGFPLDFLPPRASRADFGIGCLGAGFIMRDCHLVAYNNAGYNVVAIASRTRARADEVSRARDIPRVYDSFREVIDDPEVEILDVAVPPDCQLDVVREACAHGGGKIKGILAQKPLAADYRQAREVVDLCREAGIVLAVNHNMRFDQSVRALKSLFDQGALGEPVLGTIEMRAIPHWMPWQERQGWVTLRIMSIHHLDTFRYWFGDPERIYCSFRPDPRTLQKFAHEDGICLYILEYANGLRASGWDDVWAGPAREGAGSDCYIKWRVEGTEGLAWGTIGWPTYPNREPSTLHFSTIREPNVWFHPQWDQVWFPDAFEGTMAQLLVAVENGTDPEISGQDNLKTMALVEAGYRSAREKRAVEMTECWSGGELE